ncbi:MAG: hypothetical protein Tsb009_21960 [Planctomycetaceae bacterium]
MDQRTKILAGILCGLIVIWGGWKLFYKWGLEPIRTKKNLIAAREREIDEAGNELVRLEQAKKRLKEWTEASLPPNETDAQRLYKDWVTALAAMIGFDDLEIIPGRRQEQMLGRGREKRSLYHSVEVKLSGKTNFSRLNRFLYYFHRARLMHRISNLKINSEENEGDPLLTVKITAEALSLSKAKKRSRLFPETSLAAELEPNAKFISVVDSKGFPAKGIFHVRIEDSLLTVTERDGNTWNIQPGIESPPDEDLQPPQQKPSGTRVELFPVRSDLPRNLAEYRKDVFGPGKNPFVLPEPPVKYNPRWEGLTDHRITRGDSLNTKVELVDYDPKQGKPTYKLGKVDDPAPGLTINPQTGELKWTPAKTDTAKSYTAEVQAFLGASEKPALTGTMLLTLQEPNSKPVLESIAKRNAMIGQPIAFQVKATDPDPDDKLTFKLSDAPEGATIDESTGVFKWTPSESMTPREYTFTVTVSDNRSDNPQTDSQTVTINLQEDKTRLIFLTGIVTEGKERQAWLRDISTRKIIVLTEGFPFEVAGFSGFVYVIGNDFLEYQSGGESYRLEVGQYLADRIKLKSPAPKSQSTPNQANTTEKSTGKPVTIPATSPTEAVKPK